VVGVDVNDWSLRELVAAVRCLGKIERQRHKREWADRAFSLALILNRIPSFSSTPAHPVHPDDVNPYKMTGRVSRGIPLKRGDPASSAALRAAADRAKERR
jgi:hypothetical protein